MFSAAEVAEADAAAAVLTVPDAAELDETSEEGGGMRAPPALQSEVPDPATGTTKRKTNFGLRFRTSINATSASLRRSKMAADVSSAFGSVFKTRSGGQTSKPAAASDALLPDDLPDLPIEEEALHDPLFTDHCSNEAADGMMAHFVEEWSDVRACEVRQREARSEAVDAVQSAQQMHTALTDDWQMFRNQSMVLENTLAQVESIKHAVATCCEHVEQLEQVHAQMLKQRMEEEVVKEKEFCSEEQAGYEADQCLILAQLDEDIAAASAEYQAACEKARADRMQSMRREEEEDRLRALRLRTMAINNAFDSDMRAYRNHGNKALRALKTKYTTRPSASNGEGDADGDDLADEDGEVVILSRAQFTEQLGKAYEGDALVDVDPAAAARELDSFYGEDDGAEVAADETSKRSVTAPEVNL